MSLIVRLQGLPAVANSVDIREFFAGLSIPRGGVYITGGKYGEAYIVFGTYEEARCALNLSGRVLKDSYIRLTYSSEEEMRCALEAYQIGLKPSVGTAYNPEVSRRTPDKRTSSSFSYIYVHGMPVKATKVEIREFFRGLLVEDVLFLRFANGIRNGNAIVKFGRSADANEGLKLHSLPICGSSVTIKLSNEVEWVKNGGEPVVNRSPHRYSSRERRRSRSRGRYRSRSRGRYRSRSRGRYRSRSRGRYRRRTRSRSRSRYRSRSPYGRSRHRSRSPYVREYYVHIINLSYRAERDHLKMFFTDLTMKDSQITFLVDKEGKRTREGFAMFTTEKDYRRALSLDNELFKGHRVTILPISKKDMLGLIERMKVRLCKVTVEKEKEKSESEKKPDSRSSKEKRCLYLRNFAFDVTRADVKKFFVGNIVKEDSIVLLLDNKGVGLGEALVKFANEKEASKAEKENCQTYLGIKILMSRITEEQMKALQVANKAEETIVTEADDMPDFTSDSIPDLTPSVGPDLTSDSLPKPAPSVEPDFTSDSIPDLAPSVEPDFTSDSIPDLAPSVEPDFTSDSLPDPAPSVEKPPVTVNGESSVLEAKEVVKQSDSETVPPSNIESETKAGSDIVKETPLIKDNTEEPPNDEKEDPPFEKVASVKSEVTVLFVRNLPTSVTAAEILDFFHDFKVISVNLKNIERGIATLRMPNFAAAVSAIETLHKKEVGQKQVFLTLI